MKKKLIVDKGFTFVETMIVLAIALILSAGVGMTGTKYIAMAKKARVENQLSVFSCALQNYCIDCGCYPSSEQGLLALFEKPYMHPVPANWNGPYVDRVITPDPWGNPYIYKKSNEAGLPFSIYSLGSDGMIGGEGEARDIFSWK